MISRNTRKQAQEKKGINISYFLILYMGTVPRGQSIKLVIGVRLKKNFVRRLGNIGIS
jgi:hypothetical protein